MKPKIVVVVFVMLVISSIVTGWGSYRMMESEIVADINQALKKTLAEKSGEWVAQDSIKAYRHLQGTTNGAMAMIVSDRTFCRNLVMEDLRDKAYMSLKLLAKGEKPNDNDISRPALASDTIVCEALPGMNMAFCGYAECSFMTIYGMSDQKLSLSLFMLALLWAGMSFRMIRKSTDEKQPMADNNIIVVGGMMFLRDRRLFMADDKPVRFTPMQQQLMEMFFNSPDNRLTKTEICDALWPKKEDASETLYTLMRRLKPIVETVGKLRIEADRGRGYCLKVENFKGE